MARWSLWDAIQLKYPTWEIARLGGPWRSRRSLSSAAVAANLKSRPTLLRLAGGILIIVAVVLLLTSHSSVSNAAPVRGAAAIPDQPQPQENGEDAQPGPKAARSDRGPVVADGCMVGKDGTESDPKCVYGSKRGKWTVYLFGDSHAMQYFPPLEKLAKKNGWRLVVLNKRECSPADTPVLRVATDRKYGTCSTWHAKTLRQLEQSAGRGTVVLSGDKRAQAFSHGHGLSGKANTTAMKHGYERTLNRIRRAGLGAIVFKDLPSSPQSIPQCVADNIDHLKDCAFPQQRDAALEFDAQAAHAAAGVRLLDLSPQVCPHGLCRGVIGNALVYRDKHHLTATYARTLSPWIARELKAAGAPSKGR
jgi:hypothetical protein